MSRRCELEDCALGSSEECLCVLQKVGGESCWLVFQVPDDRPETSHAPTPRPRAPTRPRGAPRQHAAGGRPFSWFAIHLGSDTSFGGRFHFLIWLLCRGPRMRWKRRPTAQSPLSLFPSPPPSEPSSSEAWIRRSSSLRIVCAEKGPSMPEPRRLAAVHQAERAHALAARSSQ